MAASSAPRARRGIEADPARAGEIDLHPGVGVPHAHGEVAAVRVPLAPLKAAHHARRDAQRAQHDGQRGREVLAIARAAVEEELLQRRQLRPALEVERVAILAREMRGEPQRGFVGVTAPRGDLAGERGDAWGQGRKLEKAGHRGLVERQPRPAPERAERGRGLQLRLDPVVQTRRGRGYGNAAHVVERDLGGARLQPQRAWGGEDDLGADGLQEYLLDEQRPATPKGAHPVVAGRRAAQGRPVGPAHRPGAAVELVEDDAPPARSAVSCSGSTVPSNTCTRMAMLASFWIWP